MILKKGADMKNRLTIISLCMCLVFCSFSFAFADGDTNIDSKYMSDYSIETQVERDTFNPGEFTVDLALTAVDWLGGGVSDKSTSLKFKTGARMISLSEKLPNLAAFAVAEEIAKASMTGNTFLCSRLPGGTWDGQTGEWKTIIDAPVENIRSALNDFNGYLTVTDMEMRDSAEAPKLPAFYDNMILLKAGTSIQYGNTVITFKKDCEIDELYDEYAQKEYYKSTFAENIYRIQQATETTEASESAIVLNLAKNSYIQFCEKKILANSNISVSIDGADAGDADPLSAVSAALQSAEKTSTKYKDSEGRSMVPHQDYRPYGDVHKDKTYYIHKCDVNGVFDSGFGLINELLGVFAQKDANFIVIADGEASESAGREPDPDAEVSAEIKISSPEAAPCEHLNTYVEGEIKPTVTTAGYSGDVYCADCGEFLSEGEMLDKLPSSIKLKYTSLTLKVGQSTTAEKVTFVKGDSIKSVTSSNSSIVKGVKSGSTGIKLTAGKKTGTAKVTVKLAGGKSAAVTVKVQKSAVACTGLTVSSGTSVSIKKGKTHQIKVTRKPVTCVQKITYKSSKKSVATVTSSGKVKAVKKGTAKITIKCGTKTKTVKITVK